MKAHLIGLCIIHTSVGLNAQSIYSFEGLGNIEHQGMPNNFSMGEVGIGTPTPLHANTLNPANLVYNQMSTFQIGLEIDRREFSGENVSGDDLNGSLRFMVYSFPIITGKWTSSFGILPYSTVQYNTFNEGFVDGTNNTVRQFTDNRGSGGLTHLFWSNGLAITKDFYLGVRSNFTFGTIEKQTKSVILGDDIITNNTTFVNTTSYSDINFQFGASYRKELTPSKYLHFGLTFSPQSKIAATQSQELNRLTLVDDEIETINIGESTIDERFPSKIGWGVSYRRLNKFTLGIDFQLQNWSDVQNNSRYTNLMKFALGAEWIPDFDNIKSILKRSRYRFGINAQRLPYIVNDQNLTDFGINFGASVPVNVLSSVDLGFKLGRLGDVNNGLIRETYFKVVIGATINDQWFIKRKYN